MPLARMVLPVGRSSASVPCSLALLILMSAGAVIESLAASPEGGSDSCEPYGGSCEEMAPDTSAYLQSVQEKPRDQKHKPQYCTPDHDCWPSADQLRKFNATLNGKLQAPPFQNRSYDDSGYFQNAESSKFLPSLVVQVGSVDDVKKAIKFAASHRIRVIVKNLGNSFRGESSGSNALMISTRGLWEISADDSYESCGSTFPALKVGGGVIWGDVYKWMHNNKLNYSSPGGTCESVSASGGWIQGIGLNSQVGRMYGFGVDLVLEFEIVLPSGEHILANECSHPSIFKVLRGGGGGSWGVIISVRYQLLPQSKYQVIYYGTPAAESMSMWRVLAKHAVDMDRRLQIVNMGTTESNRSTSLLQAPHVVKPDFAQPKLVNLLSAATRNASVVSIMFLSFMGELRDLEDTEFYKDLSSAGVKQFMTQSFDTFAEMKIAFSGPSPPINYKTCNAGMRLIPRSLYDDQEEAAKLMYNVSFHSSSAPGPGQACGGFYHVGGAGFDNYKKDPGATYVNPKTREAIFIVNVNDHAMNKWWLAQGWTGTSINHQNWAEPNWQENAWGLTNYKKLLKEKKRIDPKKLFHCRRCVGWTGD